VEDRIFFTRGQHKYIFSLVATTTRETKFDLQPNSTNIFFVLLCFECWRSQLLIP